MFEQSIATLFLITFYMTLQVSGTGTLYSTLSELWKYEGMGLFTKAITARMTQSAMFSFSIILGYETVKRWSLLEEHKDEVRW